MNNAHNLSIYRLYAPVYDWLIRPFFHTARQRAIDTLHLQPNERLLISGAGTGLDLPLIPAGVRTTAVDLSAAMLAKGRGEENGRVDFGLMDAQQLAIGAETFDAVALNLILSVVPDGAAAFAEAWRVLRPNGRLLIFDKFLPENGRVSPLRRTIGKLIAALGTDPNRRLSDILHSTASTCIVQNEASLLRGQYRIILLHKPALGG